CMWASPVAVGRFDPDRIVGFSELSRVRLGAYRAPAVVAADDPTRELLGEAPLRPGRNLGGYMREPPALLTTLERIDEILAVRAGPRPHRLPPRPPAAAPHAGEQRRDRRRPGRCPAPGRGPDRQHADPGRRCDGRR